MFRVIGVIVLVLWFAGAWYNSITGGKLLAWFDSADSDDESLPEVPDSFAILEKNSSSLTPIQQAISDGLSGTKDLEEAIGDLELEVVSDESDATAICAALQDIAASGEIHGSSLVGLLEIPESERVYMIFHEKALPLIYRIFLKQRKVDEKNERGDLFQLMRVLVAYGYEPAFHEIAEASRNSSISDDYWWVGLFNNINEESPASALFCSQLANPLPRDFARVAFLDWANRMCIESKIRSHPFDTSEGIAALEEFLTDSNPENISYAVSATAAIPFITNSKRDSLLMLSRDHPDSGVQLEAAWAKARLKMPDGISELSAAVLDWRKGARARRYMEELGLRDEIPPEALDKKFVAKSRMADWLAHPQELGRFPDSLKLLDQRELRWPATGEIELQSLLHWKLDDDEGISWTGSSTWALFSSAEPGMPILDLYAMYNSWEMLANKVEGAPESFSDLEAGREILLRANPEMDWGS